MRRKWSFIQVPKLAGVSTASSRPTIDAPPLLTTPSFTPTIYRFNGLFTADNRCAERLALACFEVFDRVSTASSRPTIDAPQRELVLGTEQKNRANFEREGGAT
jgi:hypothetical protein